jgi:hypothetical protein
MDLVFRCNSVAFFFTVDLGSLWGIAGDRGNTRHNEVRLAQPYLIANQINGEDVKFPDRELATGLACSATLLWAARAEEVVQAANADDAPDEG